MPSRRDLLLGAAAGLALAGCGEDEEQPRATRGLGAGDAGVVAFALSLERFERDLYAEVVRSGRLSGEDRRLAQQFGEQEAEHTELLESVLERFRAPEPAEIEVDFERLVARGRTDLIRLLADVEDLGASAYLGAAPDLLDRDLLKAALSIHTVEARHAATFRRRLRRTPTPDDAFSAPATPTEVRERLTLLLAGEAAS